jgi:branched-chain amino acid transport system ATP-binding protein
MTTTDPVATSDTAADPPTPLLSARGITLRYGDLTAVDSVDLVVPRGGRHALIGPNGAGKSSFFSVLAGSARATSGSIELAGVDISSESEVHRARRGLVRTYQHANLFVGLSALDNIRIAVERAQGRPLRPWPSPQQDRRVREVAAEHLAAVGLADRSESLVSSLSHGERRQLEVGMVLACEPEIVLFDEPTAGMSAAETLRFTELVRSLPRSIATVIVEHDLDVVFQLADQISVLAAGRLIAVGTPEEVRADDAVRTAYLGADRTGQPLFLDGTDAL